MGKVVGLATHVGLDPTKIRRNRFIISLLAYCRKREPHDFSRGSRSEEPNSKEYNIKN